MRVSALTNGAASSSAASANWLDTAAKSAGNGDLHVSFSSAVTSINTKTLINTAVISINTPAGRRMNRGTGWSVSSQDTSGGAGLTGPVSSPGLVSRSGHYHHLSADLTIVFSGSSGRLRGSRQDQQEKDKVFQGSC